MVELVAGDPAPAFTLTDATDRSVSLSDYAGGRVIVYFYPAALTPGCTVQAIDFSAAAKDFAAAGYGVVGISPDHVDKLARFTAQEHLHLVLLADPGRSVIQSYGAWGARVIWGKSVEGVIRSTFVVAVDQAGQGVITHARYGVRAAGHVDRLRVELGI
ncbi:MAG: peroxiredoxin [Propionibacteriaceae bacterium]|jgi:peroxiredoxin Q/BCP|nr:peroxiredoxin [Propionibacteriaceae bacterium]